MNVHTQVHTPHFIVSIFELLLQLVVFLSLMSQLLSLDNTFCLGMFQAKQLDNELLTFPA